jgi:hypothetical protein
MYILYWFLIIALQTPFNADSVASMSKYMLLHIFMSGSDSVVTLVFATINFLYSINLTLLWMAQATCLYSFVHHIKHLVIMNCLQNMKRERNPVRALSIIDEISIVNKEFTNIFSIIPCLMFGCNFAQATGYIMAQIADAGDSFPVVVKVRTLSISLILLTFPVVLVVNVNKLFEKASDMATSVAKMYTNKSSLSSHDVILINKLESCITKEKIWFICDMDRSVFLTFIGSMISFSALFYQLIKQ